MKEDEGKYIEELEQVISQFLKPVKDIPFHLAIKALYGHRVLSINQEDSKDKELLDDLEKVASTAGRNASVSGIFKRRANEVGNAIEPYVKEALTSIGLKGETPERADGKRQATGYPDIYFLDRNRRHVYLECKTYNLENIGTTLRAFYLSPPQTTKSKVIYDAYHLILSYEMRVDESRRNGNLNCYLPVEWMLVSIHSMKVDVKHEFNASNREMYRPEAILRDGRMEETRTFF